MTAIETRPQNMPLAQPGDFSREQIDLIKNTVAVGCTDLELALFLEVCKSTGLSPFAKQVYAIKRKSGREDKMTIQTGIDGYRLIASRTGTHLGTSDPEFGPLNAEGYPEWARVVARRLVQGHIAEFPATARWSEYVQTKNEWKNGQATGNKTVSDMWAKMPYTMLGKCCEGLALRKAFPAELSGIYTDTEMAQADNPAPAPQQAQPRTVDVTRQIVQATNPNAALEAWVVKIGEAGTKINGLGGRERAVAALAHFPDWRKDVEQARSAFDALREVGRQIKEEQAAAQDTPPFDVAPVEELLLSEGQRKALCAHASRAGAKTSEDRAALWGYSLNSVKPEGTKTLTAEQAHVLLDTFSGLDNSEAEQMLAEARRAFKSAAEAQS
ncbi:hypothetical protein GCM10022631_12070 [Deinococcus rubellus]|uniref:Phage recombination protein Bet n=1 Tax=Deinococcus rubellus TaxID=1889240 RepID=A0ABY5YCG4_9DEIO|nr:phage recombination protein Bet [Deinococcus rubellus]UWX62747.1 phage recombination protein Bet [Deinococcus rubellus]